MKLFLTSKAIAALLLAIFQFASTTGVAQRPDSAELEQIRAKRLDTHSFQRDEFNPTDLELLLGNGKMGGMLALDGLGFDAIWRSDLWQNPDNRLPVHGPRITLDSLSDNPESIQTYSQQLTLADGVATTTLHAEQAPRYQTQVFFSAQNPDLLVLKLRNLSPGSALVGTLTVPEADYEYLTEWPDYQMGLTKPNRFALHQISESHIEGRPGKDFYTESAWSLRSSQPLAATDSSDQFRFSVPSGEELVVFFALATKWDSDSVLDSARNSIAQAADFASALQAHQEIWISDWATTPLLLLPDARHERLFYQSVFWLFATAGSEHFLPGEGQFGSPCWNMRPFTYGAAGWSTLALMQLGHFDKAKRMLDSYFKPQALAQNSHLYVESPSPTPNAPFSFAHEIRTDGTTTKTCDEQRHLNGFALAMFHKYYLLTGDEAFLQDSLYPVAQGVAQFWSELAIWDEDHQAYIFPELRSVSEELFEKSLLDIVMSAKWSLQTAIHYSELTQRDPELRTRWAEVLQKLYIPENETYYLEFLDDTETREYSSYQGVRAPVYLGYPTNELTYQLDGDKSRRTLEHAWKRNHQGHGMLGFIANWYALAAQTYGLGDLALEMANQNFNCFEPSQTALCEGPDNLDRYYFLTTTSSYILFPLRMLVQSDETSLTSLPAIPESWKNVSFYNIPASHGRKVSGQIVDGEVKSLQTD
ncbi:MAG: hypothetical protein AB3N63_13250 [Puniceicoccaceae bacterium]